MPSTMSAKRPSTAIALITDLDGVISDLVSEFLLRASELAGAELHAPWEVGHHDELLAPFDGCPRTVRNDAKSILLGKPAYAYISARPYFCGLLLLELWAKNCNGPIYFVSSRPPALFNDTVTWLARWVGRRGQRELDPATVFCCGTRAKKISTMLQIAGRYHDATILDDDPRVASGILAKSRRPHVVLIPQPWNAAGQVDQHNSLSAVLHTLGLPEDPRGDSPGWR